MRRPWTRRAGAFWQAFVHAHARGQLAPAPPRRAPGPIAAVPREQVRRIEEPAPCGGEAPGER